MSVDRQGAKGRGRLKRPIEKAGESPAYVAWLSCVSSIVFHRAIQTGVRYPYKTQYGKDLEFGFDRRDGSTYSIE
jgi:hypothetical protein